MIIDTKVEVELFNRWYENNYSLLLKYCKRYRIEQDTLQDVYLNIHQRILNSGYTTTQYLTYVKHSITNLNINNVKKMNGKHFIDVDDDDYCNTIENTLIDIDETNKDTVQYREDVLELSRKLFIYITTRYSDEELFVFRTYFLMPNRFTYKKLTSMTGINKNKCTKIIQSMKKDIRENFQVWIKIK